MFYAYETRFEGQDGFMVMQVRQDGRLAVEQWVSDLDYLKENKKQFEVVDNKKYEQFKKNALKINDTMNRNQVEEITKKLEQGIKDLFQSDRFKDYLKVMSRFHHYSFQNSMLISLQCPDATRVAGFNDWKNKFGRSVKKGEKGIKIFAPAPYKINREQDKLDANGNPIKDKNGNVLKEPVEITVQAYKLTTVFDISQTEGKELPELVTTLKNNVDDFHNFYKALEKSSPVSIRFIPISGGTNGFYNLVDKTISIDESLSEEQTIKTCIHEITHAILHDRDSGLEKDKKPDKMTREVQAEAVAYTVCRHFGINSSDYSFGYIAGWSSGRELSELKESMDVIRKTSCDLIDKIERNLKRERVEDRQIEKQRKEQVANNNYSSSNANNKSNYYKNRNYKKHRSH